MPCPSGSNESADKIRSNDTRRDLFAASFPPWEEILLQKFRGIAHILQRERQNTPKTT